MKQPMKRTMQQTLITTVVLAMSLSAAAGCKKKTAAKPHEASCTEVAANVSRIGKGLGNLNEAVAKCEEEKWPVSLRNCWAKANDFDGLGACVPPSMVPKAESPPITRGPGVVGAKAGSGSAATGSAASATTAP